MVINSISSDEMRSRIFKLIELCRMLGENCSDLSTITSPDLEMRGQGISVSDRKVIMISWRYHPRESHASWVMIGEIDVLTRDMQMTRMLRDTLYSML